MMATNEEFYEGFGHLHDVVAREQCRRLVEEFAESRDSMNALLAAVPHPTPRQRWSRWWRQRPWKKRSA